LLMHPFCTLVSIVDVEQRAKRHRRNAKFLLGRPRVRLAS
jgi:hypothetical protein